MQKSTINKFIKYNKIELYEFLTISIIHPSNQKFITRYDWLIYILLSIDENKFMNQPLSQKKFKDFIKWFEKHYSSNFISEEDFTPFNQLNLIPFLTNRNKYYFFYGLLERPYEILKNLYEIIFSLDIDELKDIKNFLLLSLQKQTNILTKLYKDREAQIVKSDMYVPTRNFMNRYKAFFQCHNYKKEFLHNFNLKKIQNEAPFYQMGINNFNGIYTKIDNKYFFLPFEVHMEVFYDLAEKIIYKENSTYTIAMDKSLKIRAKKTISEFFTNKQMITGLMDKSKYIYTKFFDFCAYFDNKVILFKCIPFSQNLKDSIDNTIKEASDDFTKIKQAKELFAFRAITENTIDLSQIPVNIFETKVVLIFEKLALNYCINFNNNWEEQDIFLFNFLDIRPVLELIREKSQDQDIALWQYLNAKKNQSLHNKQPIEVDALDHFAYYYSNNDSFINIGQKLDLVLFAPHSWSDFYDDYLYKKFQDNIYELVEKKFPNKFNYIKHLTNSIYELVDTSCLYYVVCIKYENSLICIYYPPLELNLSSEEVEIFLFLGEFLSFYIDRYKNKIFNFLKKYNFDIVEQNLIISIISDKVIKNSDSLNFLNPYIYRVNDEYLSFYFKINRNEIFIGFIINSNLEKLKSIFEYKDNFNPEKDIFSQFIASILACLNTPNSEEIAKKFVADIWDMEERAFVLKEAFSNILNLKSYLKPLELQTSFISNVNQEMVDYLKECKISIGQYWEEDAKQLNNLIFEFLQKRLEEEISQYNANILLFAYTQIEWIEGQREQQKIQMELDRENYITFNIREKYNEQRLKTSELSICAKHILHSILKVNPKGSKNMNVSSWYYLLAMSKIINETILRSDFLHYKLAKMSIKITSLYELIDIDESLKIDFNKHYKKTTNLQIESCLISSEYGDFNNRENLSEFPLNQELNKAWKEELGFYLYDMIKIMLSLVRYTKKENNLYFPLLKISKKDIYKYLQSVLKNNVLFDDIEKILDFLSLNFQSYEEYKYIDYSIDRLMTKKERLNLSPFINIKENYIFGQKQLELALRHWHNSLFHGDMPFYISEGSAIKQELEIIHRKLDLDLEKKALNIAQETLGKSYAVGTIKNFKQLSHSFDKQPACGEIDLLAININTKTLFVLDAKNINRKFFMSAIKREVRDFFEGRNKKKSYVEKLNLKVDFVEKHKETILDYFKVTDKNNWTLKKGFVVNVLYVSEFYEKKIDFILINDLRKYLLL